MPGATPIEPGEAAGLIPSHISTHAQLNEWEMVNILEGERWAYSRKHKNLFNSEFNRGVIMSKQVQETCIVAATRTPVGKAPRGMFRNTRPDDLLACTKNEGQVLQCSTCLDFDLNNRN